MTITTDTTVIQGVRKGLEQVKALFDSLISDINNELPQKTSFTPSVLTPTAGTITGGTKVGSYTPFGNLEFFEITYGGWTQNTATSTYYTIDLPHTSTVSLLAISAVDLNTGLAIPAWINSSTTARVQVSKAATNPVNILVSGTFTK